MTDLEILNEFRESVTSIVVKVPSIVIDTPLMPGVVNESYDELLSNLAINASKFNWNRTDKHSPDTWLEMPEIRRSEFALSHFLKCASVGGNVMQGFNTFVKVAVANIDNEVPEGLPHRTYTDYTDEEYPVEVVRTWRTWRISEESYPLTLIGGFYYFVTNTFFNYLTGTELMIIHNSSDAELVDSMPSVEDPL